MIDIIGKFRKSGCLVRCWCDKPEGGLPSHRVERLLQVKMFDDPMSLKVYP